MPFVDINYIEIIFPLSIEWYSNVTFLTTEHRNQIQTNRWTKNNELSTKTLNQYYGKTIRYEASSFC